MTWKPYCYEEDKCRVYTEKDKVKPNHGPCCTCQDCGHDYDNCICQFLREPCLSCLYKESNQKL